MDVVAVALWRTQGRPILLHQQRVGEHHDFTIYKFRVTTPRAPPGGRPFSASSCNDPRITPLGKWLRASSLDQRPQPNADREKITGSPRDQAA